MNPSNRPPFEFPGPGGLQSDNGSSEGRPGTRINDVDLDAIRALRDAAAVESALDQASWRASTGWEPGRGDLAHLYGEGEGESGETTALEEQLLALVNACVILGLRTRCALDRLQLTRIGVTTTGETAMRGRVGLPTPQPGFSNVTVAIVIEGPAGAGRLRRLAEETLQASPILATLRRSVGVRGEIDIQT